MLNDYAINRFHVGPAWIDEALNNIPEGTKEIMVIFKGANNTPYKDVFVKNLTHSVIIGNETSYAAIPKSDIISFYFKKGDTK